MAIIFVAKRTCSKYDACERAYNGDFIPKLVFLVLLTFTDTLNIRLMNGVKFVGRVAAL